MAWLAVDKNEKECNFLNVYSMTELKYKVGDKVRIKGIDWYNENKDAYGQITFCREDEEDVIFDILHSESCGEILTIEAIVYDTRYLMIPDIYMSKWTDEMIECKVEEEEVKDMGEVSDGYHTFNELYEYRLLYNASMFNELAKQNLYDVHKSKRHSDGEIPFGDPNWFIVMAELPTGQISNHYEMKDWDLFQIPEKEKANTWDGHTPKDVAERLRKFLTPQPKYPQTYEECCRVLGVSEFEYNHTGTNVWYRHKLMATLDKLMLCRDAYWKIAGEEMGLGKPWEPDYTEKTVKYCLRTNYCRIVQTRTSHDNHPFSFPTAEMRDAFYEAFKEDIEYCKELL